MPKNKGLRLWVRIGDTGEYESYGDDFAAVADALRELNPTDIAQCNGGLKADGFGSANYISLYWGDKDSHFLKNLSRSEFLKVCNEMGPEIECQVLLAEMPDPDHVGQAEYRLVHDFVTGLLEDEMDRDLLCGIMDEIIETARTFKKKFKRVSTR